MTIIEFTRHYGVYNPGEIAGFDDEEARKLIPSQGKEYIPPVVDDVPSVPPVEPVVEPVVENTAVTETPAAPVNPEPSVPPAETVTTPKPKSSR